MFSLFKSDKRPTFPTRDKVWKTAEAAQKGMLMMAMMRLQQQKPALVITYFQGDNERLGSFMSENKISCTVINSSSSESALDDPQIYIIGYDSIQNSVVGDLLNKNAERLGNAVYFPCHYPIIAEEEKVLSKLSSLGFSEFIFCLSFDDPMMASFKDRIVRLLESLGLDENESIEHRMVTSSIKNVRKKINDKVKLEKKANSAAEWYALNVRPG